MMKKLNNILSYAIAALAILELLLVVLSWIVCTAFPESSFHTLLSSEGIRWFFGTFTSNLCSDILVWMLLVSTALGCIAKSKMPRTVWNLFRHRKIAYRERIALTVCFAEAMVYLFVMAMLACMPQAILLSVTGTLFPSAFSISIVASISFLIIVMGSTYGCVSRSFRSIPCWVESLSYGLRRFSILFVFYIFAVQFVNSVKFVLSM